MYFMTARGSMAQARALDPDGRWDQYGPSDEQGNFRVEIAIDETCGAYFIYIPMVSRQPMLEQMRNIRRNSQCIEVSDVIRLDDIFNFEETRDESQEEDSRPDIGFRLDRWTTPFMLSTLQRRLDEGEEPSSEDREQQDRMDMSSSLMSRQWVQHYERAIQYGRDASTRVRRVENGAVHAPTDWAIPVYDDLREEASEGSASETERPRLQETDAQRSERVRRAVAYYTEAMGTSSQRSQ